MEVEKAEDEPLDSGYFTGSGDASKKSVYFSFDDENAAQHSTFKSDETRRRTKRESESGVQRESEYDFQRESESGYAFRINATSSTAAILNLENGLLFQRRQRSFSDPFPCTAKCRLRLTKDYGSRSVFPGFTTCRSTQTCYFCILNNFNAANECFLCSENMPNSGLTIVPQRQVAIIPPFVDNANLLTVGFSPMPSSSSSSSDSRETAYVQVQRVDSTLVGEIAQNLREIADDFDHRLGAPAVAHFGANLNLNFMINNVMVALRALIAAVVWLVGR